ncbi:RNA polymerase sigma factor [Oleiharenicola lentus]|uniref:RNA polymerase sigma factor n=1 Tax=Oleiharenicola lentus TaxID=2508720 RepID=UPI003F67CED9
MSSSSAQPIPVSDAAIAPAKGREFSLQNRTRWFTENVHAHDGQLKAWLTGTFPAARPEVDDMVQESYLRIWKVRAARPIESAKSFLFTVARHLVLDHLRRQRVSPVVAVENLELLAVASDRPLIADVLSREEKLRLLAAAIVELPARTREVIILHKIEALSQAAVATRLELSPKTVENLVGRGVQRCREYLRRNGIEHF